MIFFALLLNITTLFAGNEHEHLQYLPSYEDVTKATRGRLGKYPASHFFKNPLLLQQYAGDEAIQKLIGNRAPFYVEGKPQMVAIQAELQKIIESSNFEQLAKKLSPVLQKQDAQIMRSFFELSETSTNRLESYLVSGDFRGNFFHKNPDLLVQSIDEYLKTADRSSSLKTVFSVADIQFNEKLLRSVKSLYEKRGLQVQFYLSVPRNRLFQSNFDLNGQISEVEKARKSQWLSGIDITGSARETREAAIGFKEKHGLYKERFERLFEASQSKGIPLRIHAYEGANKGPFYSAFWQAMESGAQTGKLPSQIRIGHIPELSLEDLERLSKYKGTTRFIFEANVASNLSIQSQADLSKMVQTIEQIHAREFSVVLGADGRGILGAETEFETMLNKLQKAGLSQNSLERIIHEAYLPIEGTQIPKSQLLSWQRERSSLAQRLLGSGGCWYSRLSGIFKKQAISY